MTTFLFTFVIMALAALGLAIGVMMGRKPVGGSCGGLDKLGLDCDAGCSKPCPKRAARQQAAVLAAQQEAEQQR
ncbi:MAG: (Na+)-NQR maturation NqrM [Zoogloeaceae bacterium]|nr:(Na+)-NQR maturation NqrM [Zoogloeaceae bacterium]